MSELSAGVRALLGRMESNPEEFYGKANKWAFMFEPNFREVMTEPEKGALHEALKDVRRKEFDELVIRRMLQDEANEKMEQIRTSGGGFGQAQIKHEGQQIAYDSQQHRDAHNKAYNALSNAATTAHTGQGLLQSFNPAPNSVNPYR